MSKNSSSREGDNFVKRKLHATAAKEVVRQEVIQPNIIVYVLQHPLRMIV